MAGAGLPRSSPKPWGAEPGKKEHQEAPVQLFVFCGEGVNARETPGFCLLLELLHGISTTLSMKACAASPACQGV